jgi:hypothetical protein
MVTPSAIKRPYSDEFLKTYSAEHVLYEIDMFFSAVEVLTTPSLAITTDSPTMAFGVRNGMVEVFAIHLRNLIDFLYLDNPQSSDVVASDFCQTGKWKAVRAPIPPVLENSRIRANKEIAHLTTSRITGIQPEKNWDPPLLAVEIASALKTFSASALDSRLDSKVSARIALCA